MKKRVFSGLIVALILLIISSLIACWFLQDSNTVVWAIPYPISENTQSLINELLIEKGNNHQIEFMYIEDYIGEIDQLLRTGDVDIICSPFYRWDQVGERMTLNELMYPLNDLLETDLGHQLYSAYPSSFWECMQDNGNYYWIFQGGNVPVTPAVIINKDIVSKYDLSVQEITFENICEYAIDVNISYAESGVYAISNPAQLLICIPQHTFVCSPLIPLVISDEDESFTVINMLETPIFEHVYSSLQILHAQNAIAYENITSESIFTIISYTTPEDYIRIADPNKVCVKLIQDNTIFPNEILGPGIGISKNSNKIKDSFQVVAEIYTDEELSNALVYGEPDVDYQVIDGHAASFSAPYYANPHSGLGNMFLTLPHFFQDVNKNQTYRSIIENTPPSPISGFVFDGNNVHEEITAVTKIMYEFYFELANNSQSLEKSLSDIIDQLNQNGLQTIQSEVTDQLNLWKAAK